MFKLKQIINKHHNAPEMERATLDWSTTGVAGNIYYFVNGYLFGEGETKSDILYLSLKNVHESYEGERIVECFRITPEMILETGVSKNCTPGAKFKLVYSGSYSGYPGIQVLEDGSEEESDGYIVDSSEYDRRRTVLIRFHCKQ